VIVHHLLAELLDVRTLRFLLRELAELDLRQAAWAASSRNLRSAWFRSERPSVCADLDGAPVLVPPDVPLMPLLPAVLLPCAPAFKANPIEISADARSVGTRCSRFICFSYDCKNVAAKGAFAAHPLESCNSRAATGDYRAMIIVFLCTAEALSMTGFSAYPALLPLLSRSWHLSGTEAGLIGGSFFFGYMVAVPFLSGITDRIDARKVFAGSCLLAATGILGFAALAQGVVTGSCFQALTGAGLAGTYMPGLKALTDRVSGPRQPRYIAFYTSTFGIGASVSLALVGWLEHTLPWRLGFALLAAGPVAGALIAMLALHPHRQAVAHGRRWLPNLRPVFAQPDVRRYIAGYAIHCWELFGLRSWLVAFVAGAYAVAGEASPPVGAAGVAALLNLLGYPASILGNEAAGRLGRPAWIAGAMLSSGVLCWVAGWSLHWPLWIVVPLLALYFVSVMSDSAALTAGLVAAAPVGQRGAAMAAYSLLGFGAGFVAPLVFGITLDVFGHTPLAWAIAFGTLGSGGIVWVALGKRMSRR
jgi:MFS family permease